MIITNLNILAIIINIPVLDQREFRLYQPNAPTCEGNTHVRHKGMRSLEENRCRKRASEMALFTKVLIAKLGNPSLTREPMGQKPNSQSCPVNSTLVLWLM